MVSDMLIMVFALYLASLWFQPPNPTASLKGVQSFQLDNSQLWVLPLLAIGWVLILGYFGLYKKRYMSFMRFRLYKYIDLVKATSLGMLILICIAVVFQFEYLTARAVLEFWFAATFGSLLIHELLYSIIRHMRLAGRNLRHLLIVGTNNRARALGQRVIEQRELGYSLRGFADNNWHKNNEDNKLPDPSIVSNLETITDYLTSNVVDEVVIALPMATQYKEAARIVEICEEQGVVVHFIPGFDFLNMNSTRASFDTLDDEPIITLVPPPMSGWKLAAKRFIDVSSSALGLIALLPVFLFVAVAIKVNMPGPIFFVQNRVGLNKRLFPMYKFRTMIVDAEQVQKKLEEFNEASGPVFKIDKDPRITPLGSFLRKTSLDELPQLLNVLRGEMSLVGPRPLPVRDFDGFEKDWHRRRFSVRPGITCLWQVSGRSSLTFEQWMELDMKYIKEWSLILDLKILLQTVFAVFTQRGAV